MRLEAVKIRVKALVKRDPGLTEDEIAEELGLSLFDVISALLELEKEGVLVSVEV